jgi:hypothetical protein
MPKVAGVGPYRLYFYSSDGDEPPHVHVDRNSFSAKFWLRPVRLAQNHGFSRNELARIQRVVTAHESICAKKWHDYFA